MAITRAIDSLYLYEDIDVFPESDSIWELLDQVEAFDEASVGLSDKASGQESWLERARELENKGKLKAALRYYTKAESQHDFDRCAARQDFERGESRKAIDAFFELNEYELALEYSQKAEDTDGKILSTIALGNMGPNEIDSMYQQTAVAKSVRKIFDGRRFAGSAGLIFANYLEPKIRNTKDNITEANTLLEKEVDRLGSGIVP